MSKELVIGSNRHETKVAVLEDDQLVELYFQRANEYSLAGSIHKGRVTRVLPGMQSAFVDLGLERDTFLYVSDFFEENEDIDVAEEKPARPERRDRDRDRGERSQGRGSEQRYAPERKLEEVSPEQVVEPEPFVTEAESAVPVPEAAESTPTAEMRAQEQPRGDERGFRDPRNRRGRRRRQRGRGFPESKYAQPSGSAALAAPAALEPETEEGAEPAEVIILPGESLAKYRTRTPNVEHSAATVTAEASSEEVPAEETDIAEQEAIEEEAQELELAEKILAHHDNETPEEVEEKIEEVKQDQPPPEAAAASTEEQQGAPIEHEADSVLRVDPEPLLIAAVGAAELGPFIAEDAEAEQSESSVEENEAADNATTDPAFEEAEEFDVFGIDDIAEPHGEAGLAAGLETAEPGASQTQTATVRDQGNRYPHRISRRMRRRRGGNRFGQGPETATLSGGGGTGAAVAFEPENRREQTEERTAERPDRAMPSITDLLKPGQEIIVQIAKEPLGQKGARITSHIALPGRYVVFMPSVSHMGVSRKIASDEERQRLKRILQTHRAGTTGGFIVRTAGEGVPEDEIAADMNFLYSLWLDIRQKAEKRPAPALLHYDLDIVQRILRDQVTDEFKSIWVDNEEMYENVVTFMERFQPALVNRVKMYTRNAPIFDAFKITQELEKALRPKVWLKSGGYIVINQTEALVAIDINTGKYVGKSNRLEDTIVKTNTEAVKEIVRQIRLRDLGGIIVVDFIDMDERKNRQKVMQALEDAMRADKAPYKILQFNDFGLVAITRKRVKQSLERTLCSPCPYCEGAGYVKSVQTVISEILVEAQKISKAIEGHDVVLRVNPEVAKVLKANDNHYLDELEEILGRPVLVTGDPTVHIEKFDLA
jgi:ribonuclease G